MWWNTSIYVSVLLSIAAQVETHTTEEMNAVTLVLDVSLEQVCFKYNTGAGVIRFIICVVCKYSVGIVHV